MFLKVITVVLLISPTLRAVSYKDLRTVLEWKSLEYEFPTDNDRRYATDNGLYKQNAGTPIDIEVEYNAKGNMRIFQTIPRFSDGIPFTLAVVSSRSSSNGPILKPYPNYNWHNVKNANCLGITSAFRIMIDECQQLWVLDSGVANNVQLCAPQLLTFDLKTDSLISRFHFPADLFIPTESLFSALAVDIRDPPPTGSCRNVMVYMADVQLGGLVVYSSERNYAWRIEHELMLPQLAWGNHTIAGQTFQLMNGIFSLSISPRGQMNRFLFFHVYADDRECAVPLQYIDTPMSSSDPSPTQFQVVGSRGVQSAMEAIDGKGNMFTSTDDPVSIFVWNTNALYNKGSFNVVANNPDQLQFVSGMKVVKSPYGGDELWVLSSNYHKIATNTINYLQVNFKLSFCVTDDLLENGGCMDTRNQYWPDFLYVQPIANQKESEV